MRSCDAWADRGGCVLPAGHNRGQADVPDNHLFPSDLDDGVRMGFWVQRLALIQRPRVTWCVFTRKWILSVNGHRHACGNGSFKSDQAFRHWEDALAEAHFVFESRLADQVQRALHAKQRRTRFRT